jgi:glutamate-1-semialdehyde 2,1-aminomutase
MMTPIEYDRLARLGERVRDEANAMFERASVNWQMTGFTNQFRLHPSRRKIRNYCDAWLNAEETAQADAMHHALIGR